MNDKIWGASEDVWNHFIEHAPRKEDLLPVVSNLAAVISDFSKMGGLGKTPSRYNTQKKVSGFKDWTSHEAQGYELRRWRKEPDYGICIQTRYVRAIDVDVADEAEAKKVYDYLYAMFALEYDFIVRRRPNSSKFLVAFCVEGEFSKRRMLTHTLDAKGNRNAIEFLANGQQFVAYGTHPSGVNYEWEGGLPTTFPVISEKEFETIWDGLVAKFAAEVHNERQSVKATKQRSLEDANDPVLDYMDEHWEVLGADNSGRIDIRCPWEHEHTSDSGESSTSYFPAGVGGFDRGHFRCLHSHCSHRTESDFLNAIGYATYDFDVLPELTPPNAEVSEVAQIINANRESADRESESFESLFAPSFGDPSMTHTPAEDRRKKFSGKGASIVMVDRITPAKGKCVSVPPVINMFRNNSTKGNYVGCIEAVRPAIRAAIADPSICGVQLAYDKFLDAILIGDYEGKKWALFKDSDYTRLAVSLECGDNGMIRFEPIALSHVKEAVKLVVANNQMDSLSMIGLWLRDQWDGVKRIDTFLPEYMKSDDTAYTRAIGKYMWTAIAGRMLSPGIKADMVPIAIGAQGARKTTFVSAMAITPSMFVELDLNKGENDLARELRGCVIAELGELKGFGIKQIESIKSFITRQVEKWIPKYQEFATEYSRRAIFIGTSNEVESIPEDGTGHRRWLPFTIKDGEKCDIQRLIKDKLQLYAEAINLFIENGVMWEEVSEEAPAVRSNFEKTNDDPWEQVLHEYMFDTNIDGEIVADNPRSMLEIVMGAQLVKDAASIGTGLSRRVGKCLRNIGLKRIKRGTRNLWVKDDTKCQS